MPKWLRRYSDVAAVIRKVNQVTYIVRGDAWRTKEKVVHVDKLKLKSRTGTLVPPTGTLVPPTGTPVLQTGTPPSGAALHVSDA